MKASLWSEASEATKSEAETRTKAAEARARKARRARELFLCILSGLTLENVLENDKNKNFLLNHVTSAAVLFDRREAELEKESHDKSVKGLEKIARFRRI